MGEAKRKEEARTGENSAPNTHGESSARGKRGIIISPPMSISNNGFSVVSPQFDAHELRCASLFWDEAVYPVSSVGFDLGPDSHYLESVGFLKMFEYKPWKSPIEMGRKQPNEWLLESYIQAFNQLDQQSPGAWAIAQGETSLLIKDGCLVHGLGAEFTLHRAIPVPNRDVALDDVLNFKAKRDPELLALRSEIDSLAAALKVGDQTSQRLESAIRRVDAACADALKVGRDWQFPVRLSSLKMSVKIDAGAAIQGAIKAFSESGEVVDAVIGAAKEGITGIQISAENVEWKGLRPRRGPYHYVSRFHDELF